MLNGFLFFQLNVGVMLASSDYQLNMKKMWNQYLQFSRSIREGVNAQMKFEQLKNTF